ncbi:hypothetical protein Aduo_016275 [Ancylostoma duodenale]
MTTKRGWIDSTVPRFPPEAVMEEYFAGNIAAKNKSERAMVISATIEEEVVPECIKVIIDIDDGHDLSDPLWANDGEVPDAKCGNGAIRSTNEEVTKEVYV